METKKYLYAAVGAQVAVAKAAQAKLEDLMAKLNESATSASSDAKSRINTWAGEGEEFLGKVGDTKAIDELTSKVDFDQMQTQVNKLRDQLEDIVSTWRANFRPETKSAIKVTVTETVSEAPTAPASSAPAAKTPAAKTAAAKTAAAKTTTRTTAAKTTAAKKPAAKATTTKATTTKATTAKATTAKKPAAKKPAARKAS